MFAVIQGRGGHKRVYARLRRAMAAKPESGEGSVVVFWVPGPVTSPVSLRKTRGAQRFAHRRSKRGLATNAGELTAETKVGLKLQDLRRRGPCFRKSPEFRQRRRQLHMGDAVGGIRLDRFVGRLQRLIELAEAEMTHGLRIVGSEGPGVERAQTQTTLAPLDGALGFAGPGQNDTSHDVGQRRRRTDHERRLESGECRGAIMPV